MARLLPYSFQWQRLQARAAIRVMSALTPALSPRRGRPTRTRLDNLDSQRALFASPAFTARRSNGKNVKNSQKCGARSPSPGGEGRGEGGRCSRPFLTTLVAAEVTRLISPGFSREATQAVSASLPRLLQFKQVFICAVLMLLSIRLSAHDSPDHVIETLTAEMARAGETPRLLVERAGEQRIMGRLPQAAADLEKALQLEPEFLPARIELGRVYLAQGKRAEALKIVERVMGVRAAEPERAALHMVRAEIFRAQGDYKKALEACHQALQLQAGDVDWYLTRSQLQAQLGKHQERLAGLEQGIKQTGGVVLENERVEALIDAGQHRAALALIEPQLQDSRWQSSWLIRRARARLGLGEKEKARADLRAAIAEINERFGPFDAFNPDLTLLLDRGVAEALLGDLSSARKDFQQARAAGMDEWFVSRLEARAGLKVK